MTESIAWLERVHAWFGMDGRVSADLLRHWRDSCNCSWLERNPLLAVRVHSLSGSYYENQRLLVDRLHIAVAFLASLAVRQPESSEDTSRLFSSRNVNNWQTLDIHHYFVMEATLNDDGTLTGDAVPISMDAGYLTELSDLPVDLNLDYWNQHADSAQALWLALDTVDRFQQQTRYRRGRAHSRAHLARKLFESLDYFRRSLSSDRWYAVTSLATAFEMLLTSNYTGGRHRTGPAPRRTAD
jgi:hypothetical protein